MGSLEERVARPVVLRLPRMEQVRVRRDLAYKEVDGALLCLDAYYPPDHRQDGASPAVVLIAGDPGPELALADREVGMIEVEATGRRSCWRTSGVRRSTGGAAWGPPS